MQRGGGKSDNNDEEYNLGSRRNGALRGLLPEEFPHPGSFTRIRAKEFPSKFVKEEAARLV
jgi:hypothetical protein